MVLSWIAKIFAALNSNKRPGEIAASIAFAFLLTLLPGANLLWIGLFLLMFFIKINLAVFLVFLALFALLPAAGDGVLSRLGTAVLTAPALGPFFTSLYNTPFLPYTRFNDTLVMGGLLGGLLLWPAVFLLFIVLVRLYRDKLRDRIARSKFVRGFQKIPLVRNFLVLYRKASLIYTGLS